MRINYNVKTDEALYDVYPYFQRNREFTECGIPLKVYAIEGEMALENFEHNHDITQIGFVSNGCVEHTCNGKISVLKIGDLFLIPQGVCHSLKPKSGEAALICIDFSKSFLMECITKQNKAISTIIFLFIKSIKDIQAKVSPDARLQYKVENLMTDMLYEYENKLLCYEISLQAGLLKLISFIVRNKNNIDDCEEKNLLERYKDCMNKTIQFANENFTNRIYIEDVCKLSMLSHTYFSYLFKEITGKTFVEYLNTLRIKRAMELLKDNEVNVSNICFDVGFSDVSYFGKIFKKLTGMSPTQYKQIK